MKAIDRRLRRLEERLAPQENEEVRRLVAQLRERRRRRAEASGEPFEIRPCESLTDDQNRPLSIADILRSGRRRAVAPTEQPPG
jgi:predicted RNase H-like nuclease (RuvC/YqgF family)